MTNYASLGNMFKYIHEPIDGPVLLHAYPTKNIYLIGENHTINGSGKHNHIWDIIKKYALANPSKTLRLFVEATPSDLYLLRDNCNSPLSTTITEYFKSKNTIPKNIILELVNIRRFPPMSILEILYDERTYVDMNFTNNPHTSPTDIFDFHYKAKQFERDFYKNVKTRKTCTDFFISIITPSGIYPDWFNKYLDMFNISKTINPLRELLQKIQKTDMRFVTAILGILGNMFTYTVEKNTQYSPAMLSMEKTRRSESENMVAAKYPEYMTFWISVNAIFMDIYVMCLMKVHSTTDDIFLLMAGFNHVHNIAKYLPNTVDMPCISMFNKNGILNTIGAPTFPLAASPQTLLEQFRIAIKKKHDT